MEFLETDLPDVWRIRPRLFGDQRGFFLELHHGGKFAAAGITLPFVQDNLSRSQRNVVRGLHYQIQRPQGKLVTAMRGKIFDVAVDLRRNSPTFGRWTGTLLSEENREMLYIPPGFAHGFSVLSDSADVFYKCTDLYYPEHERILAWDDSTVGVDWQVQGIPILSDKDKRGIPLSAAECYES